MKSSCGIATYPGMVIKGKTFMENQNYLHIAFTPLSMAKGDQLVAVFKGNLGIDPGKTAEVDPDPQSVRDGSFSGYLVRAYAK